MVMRKLYPPPLLHVFPQEKPTEIERYDNNLFAMHVEKVRARNPSKKEGVPFQFSKSIHF